ncbi:RraA family protein [Streptomyces sp. NPDC087440]|uniref:RraA family protein n=1 Tax=Streptomyces sp. NPDC087440 TaxID=3365790 RepID=UPI003805C86A
MSDYGDTFEPAPGDERLTSPIVSDALDAAGLRGQVFAAGLRGPVPGARCFGRAATVQFAPTAEDRDPYGDAVDLDPYGDAIDYIDALRAGAVAVLATGDSTRSAFWGELFSAAAIGRGAVGVVTDGCLRDTPKITALGFPAFARGNRPPDYRGRMRVVAAGQPVVLCGVTVRPGDLVLADDDGVAVIPREAEAEVLARARERAAGESTVLGELLGGDGLREVWSRHGIL